MTFRAVEILQKVDLVAAENTNTAMKLFAKFDIHTPFTSFHAHSNEKKVSELVEKMQTGKTIALISEAGTPGISDPGFALIQAAIQVKIPVVPIPGCCAAIAGLSGSGLRMDKFTFLGFLPLKKGRQKLFESLRDKNETIIFYESPHRILKTISQIKAVLGDERRVVLARELTKIHEEFFRGTLAEAVDFLNSKKVRGEFTVLIEGT